MKILIVGGLGYLGPVVGQMARHLLAPERLDVADLGWFLDAAIEPSTDIFDNVIVIDKRNLSVDVLSDYDVVVDLAAVSNDPMGQDFEAATLEINATAATNLAKRAKQAGVGRFVFSSSCSIYGAAGDNPRIEDDAKDPLTAYAVSKCQAEQSFSAIADDSFSITALRFATACGWSPHFRADLVLNDFVLTAMTQKEIHVLSDGTPWRPLIHVEDIGRAVAWACQTEHTSFEYYNIGSNEWTLTIGTLAEKVSALLDIPYEIKNENGPDKRSYRVAFDKFDANAPGWLPRRDLESTVKQMKQKLAPHIVRYQNFKQGNLIRLNMLRDMTDSGKLDKYLKKIGG